MTSFLDWFNAQRRHRSGPQGRTRPSLVRHHSPVRRRQRPHRARHRRHGAGALGKQPAALLQHVGADPAGAQRLLRHPRANPERDIGHHAVDGMVPRLPRPRHRRRADHSRRRPREGTLLGAHPRRRSSTTVSGWCSTACSTASKASSRRRNTPSSPSARRTPRCATFSTSSNTAFWSGIPTADAAPAIHSRRRNSTAAPAGRYG